LLIVPQIVVRETYRTFKTERKTSRQNIFCVDILYLEFRLQNLFALILPRDCSYMKDEQHQFLALAGQLPARLSADQAGWLLGCQTHDIPILIALRLLKPLGTPTQNGAKYFATGDLAELTRDRQWLVKMTQAISQHWQKCNARQKPRRGNELEEMSPISVTDKAA
jgi:hypothetical protein